MDLERVCGVRLASLNVASVESANARDGEVFSLRRREGAPGLEEAAWVGKGVFGELRVSCTVRGSLLTFSTPRDASWYRTDVTEVSSAVSVRGSIQPPDVSL